MPDDKDPDWLFQNHPDLIDKRWARQEAKAARRRARKYWAEETAGPSRPRGPFRRLRLIVAVAVVVAAAIFVVRHPWTNQEVANVFAPVRAGVTPTVRQAAAPLNLAAPFGNTPAAGWSDGAAGIQPPAATALGHYTAAQVATGLNAVRQLIVASHLDPTMIVNHDSSTYLSLLAPQVRADERRFLADPTAPDRDGGVTLLAPGFHLLPVSVKVNGTMTVAIDSDGELAIHTNYVFAYPFAPSDPKTITEPWQIVAIQHVVEDYEYVADPKMTAASQGLFVRNIQAYYDSIACAQSKQGLLAPAYANPPVAGGPDTNPYAYYDPNHAMNIPNNC